jgi:hypothetical protein
MIAGQRHTQNGRLAARGIGPHASGQQVEPGFIHKHYGTSFARGFFSNSTHFAVRHRSIAASLRWLARVIGFWRLHPICFKIRPTWLGWYDTPDSRLISCTTRGWGHTAPRNPKCSAPLAKCSFNSANWSWLKRGFGPPPRRLRKASGPSSRPRLSHWLTEPAVTPSASAMSFCAQFFWCSFQACVRRASRQSFGCCFVLSSIGPSIPHFAPLF